MLGDSTLLDKAISARNVLCSDVNMSIKCFTSTLNPKHHKTDPKIIKRLYINFTKDFICKTRTPMWCQLHYEYTQQGILHVHGMMVGKIGTLARLLTLYRRHFGFVLVKNPTGLGQHTLTGWIKYINKDNSHNPSYFISRGLGEMSKSSSRPKRSFNARVFF